jgi:regulator of protease activity HflC (stomatin/prohibitin superfamily)
MLLDTALNFITFALWATFFTYVIVYVALNARRRGLRPALRDLVTLRWLLIFLIVLLVVTYINLAAVFIEPQEVGVVVSVSSPQGYQDRPKRSGLHWISPFFDQLYRYPIYWQTYTMAADPVEGARTGDDSIRARTSDGQHVSLDTSLIFQIDPEQAVRVHIDWQGRYIEDFARPVTRGVVRTYVSQYTADEVNSSRRLALESDINLALSDQFAQMGFVLDRFILRNIAFSPEYADAVERKQIAEQGVVESEYKAQQVRALAQGEADAVVITAEADAEAIRLRAQAESTALDLIKQALGQDQSLLTYRYIDKLSPSIRTMLVPNNMPYLLPLPQLDAGEVITPSIAPTSTLTNALVPGLVSPAGAIEPLSGTVP